MKTALINTQWMRQEKLKDIIQDLNNQTDKNFDLFIWNNNSDKEKIKILENCKKIPTDFKIYIYHHTENVYGYSRFLLAHDLMNNRIDGFKDEYDKIIFFDDDQRLKENFISYMVGNYKKNSYIGQWAFKIKDDNYKNRIKCYNGENSDYIGTGGSIIDSTIFIKDHFLKTYPGKEYYSIEDIALTLYCKSIGWNTVGTGKIDQLETFDDRNGLFRKLGYEPKIEGYKKLKEYYLGKNKNSFKPFNIKKYWDERYINADSKKGYGSGPGSQDEELRFKINFVTNFIFSKQINNICDYGCGSGNFVHDLPINYKKYVAYDISENAIKICKERLKNYNKVIFTNNLEDCDINFELGISLDVIFHQIDFFDLLNYLDNLFRHKYIILYTTDYEEIYNPNKCSHVIRRKFSDLISKRYKNYSLINKEMYTGNKDQKVFLVYCRKD